MLGFLVFSDFLGFNYFSFTCGVSYEVYEKNHNTLKLKRLPPVIRLLDFRQKKFTGRISAAEQNHKEPVSKK